MKKQQQNTRLTNLIKLSSCIKIHIPSTIDTNKDFDNTKQVDDALSLFAGFFGGATSYDGIGVWRSEKEGLVKEKIKIIESNTDTKTLNKKTNQVIDFCEQLKKEMNQEAIALSINGELYLI